MLVYISSQLSEVLPHVLKYIKRQIIAKFQKFINEIMLVSSFFPVVSI